MHKILAKCLPTQIMLLMAFTWHNIINKQKIDATWGYQNSG